MSGLRQALSQAKAGFMIAVFTGVVNVLMLTGPLFMLQVYDRVLTSHSTATLLVLLLIVTFLYAMMGFLDHVRGRIPGADRGGVSGEPGRAGVCHSAAPGRGAEAA